MDFTFDNPFEDVFDAVAPQAEPVQPVQVAAVPVQPVQNVVVPPVTAVVPPATVIAPSNPVFNPALAHPEPSAVAPQTFVSPAFTPSPAPTQIYTPPVAVQNPALLPATAPLTTTENAYHPQGFVGQLPQQQVANPALNVHASPLLAPQHQTPVQPVQNTTQMPAQNPALAANTGAAAPATAAPVTVPAVDLNLNDMWREAKAPTNGRIYYYKKATRETTWTKPAMYIPLGGTTPISSAPSGQPQTPTSPATPTLTTCTPLTGFNLSALGSTAGPAPPSPLSANSGTQLTHSDNPALMHGSTNPAIVAQPTHAQPQDGLANPALLGSGLNGSNPALNLSNLSLSASNPALTASNPSLGSSNPALTASNPALNGSNPALHSGAYTNPALMSADPSAQHTQFTDPYAQHTDAQSGTTQMDSNGQFAQQLSPRDQHQQAYDPSTSAMMTQEQQTPQPMYDANGQLMYDENGQVMYYYPQQSQDGHYQMDANGNVQTNDQQSFGGDVFSAVPGSDPQQLPYGQPMQGQNGMMMMGGASSSTPGGVGMNGGVGAMGAVSAATVAAPAAAPSFPKTFRVRLPADQRQVVPFKAESTLRSVLTKICGSRGLSMDDYLAKDRSGMDISLDKTLGEINQEEISFLTPRAGVVPQDETKRKAHKLMSDIYEANAGLSSSLQAVIKNYRDPMLKSAQDVDMRKRLLSEQECNQIFSSLESITSLTKDFMSHLSSQLSTWPVDLTDMIARHSEVLPFYSEFVNNYRQNMNKLEDLRRNPDFSAFVDGVQKGLGSRLRLEDFLALPAVKISATSTLVEQLINVLTDQHPNFFMLRDFHQRLAPIANQATALKAQMEARSKVVSLENSIAKFPKKASFLHDQRVFFRDGIFELGTKKKPALCYVALFTDLMIVCKAPEKKKNKAPSPPTYEEVIAFAPNGCSVEEIGSQGWNLHLDGEKGKFTVNCSIHTSSEASKTDWVKSFKEAFHDFSLKPHLKPPVL